MARDNEVWLHGQVRALPRILINKDGDPVRAYLYLRVLRRIRPVSGKEQTIQIDCPVIRTENKDMLKIINDIEQGDMVDVKGVMTSKDVNKSSICPECGQKNTASGAMVFVTPIYICRRERGLSEQEGFALLKERNEISNTATLIGTVCKPPEYRRDKKGRDYTQFSLAVNRRYRIKEDTTDSKCDYMYVKTFGLAAKNAITCLHVNSTIFLKASIQTRDAERKTVCAHCGVKYIWYESIVELVPYYTGFLANCGTPETQDAVDSEDENEMIDFNGEDHA